MTAPVDHGRRIAEAEGWNDPHVSKAQVSPTEPAPRILVRFAYCYRTFLFTRLGIVSWIFCLCVL